VITLQLADLAVIASRALKLDTAAALDLLDLEAAEAALAARPPQQTPDDPAGHAAVLLHALVHHRPFRRANQQLALLATLQFLALNGWQANLDPPETAKGVLAELAAGTLDPAALAAWLAPRLRPGDETDPCAKEAAMRRWLPGRKRPARSNDPFARFTERARRATVAAQEEARALNHNYLGTEHLLLGLLCVDGVAARALLGLGISLQAVRAQVEEIIGRGTVGPIGHIPSTPRAKKVMDIALREALRLSHNYIGTEHLLLALSREGEGVAAQVLVKLGADQARLHQQVLRLLNGTPGSREEREPASGPAGRLPSSTSTALGLGDESGHYDEDGNLIAPLQSPSIAAGLAYYDHQLADVQRATDAAIAARDFDTAAVLRLVEKQLLDRRAQQEQAEQLWTAGADPDAVAEEDQRLHLDAGPEGVRPLRLDALVEENQRLHQQVQRLLGLLRQHGIEPDGGTSQST
jgi:prophage maintenance system killer protein